MAGLLACATISSAGDLPVPFGGNLLGLVVDSLGTPQMGAKVSLLDRYDRPVRHAITGADGRFGFAGLAPSHYALRVAEDSLLPAVRDRIAVHAGLSSVLEIRMAALFSSVEVRYTKPTSVMSDDWKWVLKTSTATRVITRELPGPATSSTPDNPLKVFTGTRALVSVSAGDSNMMLPNDSTLMDLGTAFALATTLYDRNRLTVSGIVGQSLNSGMPTLGIRSTYSRDSPEGYRSLPEIAVTAQQFYLPSQVLNMLGPGDTQAVRSSSISYYDKMDFLGAIHLEYGSSFDSLSYVDHINRVSPYARMTSSLGSLGTIAVSYSNGSNPTDLYLHQYADENDLAGTLDALSSVPVFSMRQRRLELEKRQSYEAGYTKVFGGISYGLSGFYENTNDGRLNVTGDTSGLDAANLMPDISTTTTLYNYGHYNRHGLVASINKKMTDDLEFGISAGSMGGFSLTGEEATSANFLRRSDFAIASANIRMMVPKSETRIVSEYAYVQDGALIPGHIFTTQQLYIQPGLNIVIRQPLPSFFGVGRLELSGDVRNLLAQGYLSATATDGHHMLLSQYPRTVRGGLSIIF